MEGRYRLVALDMDGTLLNSAHAITPYTRDALRRAAEAGKVTALCTGRCLSELWVHLDALPGIRYVIGENGACLYDVREDRILRRITLPDADADRVLRSSREFDVCRQIFLDNQSYIELREETAARYHIADFVEVFREGSRFAEDVEACRRSTGAGVEKINLYFTCEADRRRFRPAVEGLGLRVSDSIGVGYEISPAQATKGEGLKALCACLGISPEEAMAVGDGGNDLELMAAAGFSVAMGNAIGPVRALAGAMTDDCDHDGAAKAIEAYLLQN